MALSRKLSFWRDLASDEKYFKETARRATDGLDADIAALKSCSRVYKVAKQSEREAADNEILARAQRMLWGEPME